jgi:negative regulator of replication initiation
MIWVRVELVDELYKFIVEQTGSVAGESFSDVLNYYLEKGCRGNAAELTNN